MKAFGGALGVVLLAVVAWFLFLRKPGTTSAVTFGVTKSNAPATPPPSGIFGSGITGGDVNNLAKTVGGWFSTNDGEADTSSTASL